MAVRCNVRTAKQERFVAAHVFNCDDGLSGGLPCGSSAIA
jgi:hypothetical protein